ncbi:MAG: S8 family serine peptidase [Promethearchaeota archaeon]
MRKSRNRSLFLIFIFIATTLQIGLFLGISEINNINPSTRSNTIDLDISNEDLLNQIYSRNDDPSLGQINENSIFDPNLKDHLLDLSLNAPNINNKDKIIFLFKDHVSKSRRIDIISSIFTDCRIIRNYDIISGVYTELNLNELLLYEGTLNEIDELEKIYLSEKFESPYILDNTLQISALNKDLYPNWWIPAVGAEDLAYDGTGVRVAVIDTGIYNHPGLNIVANQNFVTDENATYYNDDIGHGTHVAGIIGGDGTGSDGLYRGVAPGVSLINARAGNASGLLEGDIVNAIEWSAKPIGLGGAGADIISMSFGGGYPYISDIITEAISNAQDSYGVIFVASAGNDGPEYFTGSSPASGIDVISVGATTITGNLASFSSWGPTFKYIGYPDVVAPGVNIISTEAKNSQISKEKRLIGSYFDFAGDADYIPLSGTSMAAPVVSGALAILKQAYPNITAEAARIALLEGAKKLTGDKNGDILKSGVGLINVSASLDFLSSISPDYNNITKIFPDNLPVKPYDLIQFPGDRQKFNVTVISGMGNTFDVEISNNIPGISIISDKTSITFANSGISLLELDITVDKNAIPGLREIELNLISGGQVYDVIDMALEIRLPEYRILMESYHGLNDWFPEISFNQLGFYEAMNDIYDRNVSIDYSMEYWTPDYDKNTDNSILTEERLTQYDMIILQTPLLQYSPAEILNLKNYFNNGGSILFLGTRYQDMVIDNINALFSSLELDTQINEENIMNDNWLGIGATVSSQSVYDLNNPIIFNNVSRFIWEYGNSFTISGNAKSIASIDNKTIAVMYNGTQEGKGRFLAFGDLHWLLNDYNSPAYYIDHFNLVNNILSFLLPVDEISISIDLGSELTSNSQIDLSIYLKNQILKSPITSSDYDSLEVTISNESYSKIIYINTTYSNDGLYFNNTYFFPTPSYKPYTVLVNLTIGLKSYTKLTRVLFFDNVKMPKINNLLSSDSSITRSISETNTLNAELDGPTYNDFNGFLSIYSSSFYNSKKSLAKNLTFSHIGANIYRDIFDPETNDPSGDAIFYIVPTNDNYTNPNSPRHLFNIINNEPEILKSTSYFNLARSSDILFEDTESDDGSYVYTASQGSVFNFVVDVQDSVGYEDDNSNMRVFINFFMATVNDGGFLMIIFPNTVIFDELTYQSTPDLHEGSFTIPNSMLYPSLGGTKTVSTAANFDFSTNQGYLSILLITVYDSEGGSDDFIIILLISESPMGLSLITMVIIVVIAVIVLIGLSIYLVKRRKSRYIESQPAYRDYYQRSYDTLETQISEETQLGSSFYCPFCGVNIRTPKKFCPSCGESLEFSD